MAVDDIGDPIHVVQRRKSRLCEVAVFGDIVNEISVWISPAEKLFVVNKIVYHAVPDILHDAHIIRPAIGAEVHLKRSAVNHFLLILPRDALIAGKDDFHIAVLLHQRLGKRVHHIAQAAGLDKWIAFRTDEHDAPSGGRISLFRCGRFCGLFRHDILRSRYFCRFLHRGILFRSFYVCRLWPFLLDRICGFGLRKLFNLLFCSLGRFRFNFFRQRVHTVLPGSLNLGFCGNWFQWSFVCSVSLCGFLFCHFASPYILIYELWFPDALRRAHPAVIYNRPICFRVPVSS